MALLVEDGTGLAGAESYASVADATAYHAARGNAAWAALASDTIREQNLRKATDYMVQVYRLRWKGWRVSVTQALDWPRSEVERADYAALQANGLTTISGDYYYPADEVPAEVEKACFELALAAIAGDLNPDIGRRTIREKVDVIEVEYDRFSPLVKVYRDVDGWLSPLLEYGGSGAFRKVTRT
jgi:hypothetical protein